MKYCKIIIAIALLTAQFSKSMEDQKSLEEIKAQLKHENEKIRAIKDTKVQLDDEMERVGALILMQTPEMRKRLHDILNGEEDDIFSAGTITAN
jgi:hypothetical protein